MPRRTELPPELAARPFTVAEGAAQGVGRQRLRDPALSVPFRGVRSSAPPDGALEWCHAYVPRLAPGQVFSHDSAALLYGLPLPRRFEQSRAVHVSAVEPAHPPQARGVTGHRLASGTPVRSFRGLPLVHPVLAWSQLAGSLGHDDLVVAGDFLVRRKGALSSLAEMRDYAASSRARGIRALRAALVEVRERTDSPMETRTRLVLVRGGLPEPVVGYAVKNKWGDFVATPDLAYVEQRVAIEYQGSPHWTNPRVFAEDITRREALAAAGWVVIEVIAEHLGLRAPILISRVREALER